MKNIWKAVENATNIAVIVAVCLVAVLFYRTYKNEQPEGPKIGTTLPSVAGYNWQSNANTINQRFTKSAYLYDYVPIYGTFESFQ